ncbi:hypothetical protein [Nostoc sp. UHCC 0870]|uniref:hypothetical protein n=1 Tax=Nostoc sp. UHCC 0870 TaxID=2914041 RepID=UPI001EDF5DB5|nr:hypothetical protein [Nostoc sp. UHCC 0870]UKO99142.1 hypothetical protein L6494_05315 [Nostoc sp. UHCC 0870]
METKQDEWKVLQLFTVSVVAIIFSSALSNSALVKAASVSELTIEERLVKVRKHIQQRGDELIDSYCTVSSRQDDLEVKEEWKKGPYDKSL